MAAGRSARDAGTASRILDVAERLVQVRGFNGFSYADIAAELQITKAALHYHFASKADLGEALIARYADRFMAALASLDTAGGTGHAKLDAYAGLYRRCCATARCACAACSPRSTRPSRSRCKTRSSISSTRTKAGSSAS